MFKFTQILLLFIVLIHSSNSLASTTFKSIGKAKYFAPLPYSNAAMNKGKIRGGVTIAGKFAIATLKPSSSLGLAKQVIKTNPYAIAAMLAATYFQDDINQWMNPPELDFLPKSPPEPNLVCAISSVSLSAYSGFVGKPCSDLEPADLCQTFYENDPRVTGLNKKNQFRNMSGNLLTTPTSVELHCTFEAWNKREINWVPTWVHDSDRDVKIATFGTTEAIEHTCPPVAHPDQVKPLYGEDGLVNGCVSPESYQKSLPTPLDFDVVAPLYADDILTKWQNESIDALQSWAPFVDGSGNVEPEYIKSYNQPVVSPTFNEYLKSVADGTNQSIDPSAAHYVPADMVQPTQIAINSISLNQPFVDPVLQTVVNPTISTQGAATVAPAPTGAADSPINITGDITVNVEIPEDDTISQTEYEASNAAFFEQMSSAASGSQANVDSNVESLKTQDSDFIDSLTPDVTNASGIPDFPSMAGLWQIGGGACIAYTSEASIAGSKRVITYDKHCPTYNIVVHPLLVWFLYISTALYIIHLAGRTFKSTVS